MKRLEGKAAIVTGAGTGIGEAIAHKFALEGAHVLVSGLPGDPVEAVASAIREQYPDVKVESLAADIAVQENAEACVQQAVAAFGKLDVLVNNAGTLPETNELQDFSTESFEKLVHNNIYSAFMMTRAALPELQKTRGNVVAAGSEAGVNGTPMFTPYGATKGWMHAFIKGVAMEQAKHGVRANCFCPGPIDTYFTNPDVGPMDDQLAEMTVTATAMGRLGTSEEMANVAAFLASDEASYVTGALFLADGGVTPAHGLLGEQVPAELKRYPPAKLKLSQQLSGGESDKPTGE